MDNRNGLNNLEHFIPVLSNMNRTVLVSRLMKSCDTSGFVTIHTVYQQYNYELNKYLTSFIEHNEEVDGVCDVTLNHPDLNDNNQFVLVLVNKFLE